MIAYATLNGNCVRVNEYGSPDDSVVNVTYIQHIVLDDLLWETDLITLEKYI